MTNGDFLLGETSRRETVAWLVRFTGWALLASLGAGLVVGVLVAVAQAPAGAAVGAGLVASLLTVAVMCVATERADAQRARHRRRGLRHPMTGFAAFALPVVALLAFIAGQWVLGLALLGAAAVCFLLLGRVGATRR